MVSPIVAPVPTIIPRSKGVQSHKPKKSMFAIGTSKISIGSGSKIEALARIEAKNNPSGPALISSENNPVTGSIINKRRILILNPLLFKLKKAPLEPLNRFC